jgi:RimJ/RimL family protein N-acetyltransferase
MHLEVIRALAMVDNAASNHLLQKLGFRRVETLPSLRACGGVLCDFHRYERRSCRTWSNCESM